ncbi:methyltransferase [Nostocales cyanobacterium HT-58-2]|nr:methyltransferase [Nostocales cyanobacterium HT-58-2]
MLSPEKPQTVQSIQPHLAMRQMIYGTRITQSIYAAAKLGIADLLKDGSKSCDELANAVGVKSKPLYRLLRALASVGVFAEEEQRHFTLTPLATYLVSDIPGSLRSLAIMNGDPQFHQPWGEILYSLQTGSNAFEHLYGMSLFEYHAQNSEAGKVFDEAMTSLSGIETALVAANYDFSTINKLVDVGGGQGLLMTSILKAYPAIQGILFELPAVTAGTKELLRAQGVLDRCEVVAGSFLESVPSGGDAYILKYILHNWDDEDAIAILKNCHRAMKENGKLLLIEHVIPPNNEPFDGKFLDLVMMLVLGGCERTTEEYRTLLEASGFQLTRIVPMPSSVSVIESVRV